MSYENTGSQPKDGRYVLKINGRRSDELPAVTRKAPEISKGDDDVVHMEEEYKWARFPIFVKGSH